MRACSSGRPRDVGAPKPGNGNYVVRSVGEGRAKSECSSGKAASVERLMRTHSRVMLTLHLPLFRTVGARHRLRQDRSLVAKRSDYWIDSRGYGIGPFMPLNSCQTRGCGSLFWHRRLVIVQICVSEDAKATVQSAARRYWSHRPVPMPRTTWP